MNRGSCRHRRRRRRLGPIGGLRRWVGGLSACAAVLAVLGLGLGAGHRPGSPEAPASSLISHSIAMAAPAARPPAPDDPAAPLGVALLIVTLGFVVTCFGPAAATARVYTARPSDRAPPGLLLRL